MAIHSIPRNLKGENRILIIFSTKALIYTVIGAIVGLGINTLLFSIIKASIYIKLAVLLFFAGIGFCIATLKMPDSGNFEITRKTGGEKIDEVIIRAIKFKLRKNRIYLYTKEEEKNG